MLAESKSAAFPLGDTAVYKTLYLSDSNRQDHLLNVKIQPNFTQRQPLSQIRERVCQFRQDTMFWWEWLDSNQRRIKPSDLQSDAIVTRRHSHIICTFMYNATYMCSFPYLVETHLIGGRTENKILSICFHVAMAFRYFDVSFGTPSRNRTVLWSLEGIYSIRWTNGANINIGADEGNRTPVLWVEVTGSSH